MQQAGVIEEVPADQVRVLTGGFVYYMPHRPVVKEFSISTKVRPVFNASAKGHNNVSLSNCLETGSSLIPDLLGILKRFRRWKFALCADITKAFFRVGVHPVDRDVHRFFWNDQAVTRVMRFTQVPFGSKSSPFLLNATIRYHLSQYLTSPVVEELTSNMYVDNSISRCDGHVQACDMTRKARVVSKLACVLPVGKLISKLREVASRAEMHTSMEYSQELCWLTLEIGVVGGPWVWRCLGEGLWSMCVCQSSGSGWLLVSLLGVLLDQSYLLKRVSLPRLELLGTLLYSHLVVQVREALKLHEYTVCHYWTDSTMALAWIKSDPHRWKPLWLIVWQRFSLLQHILGGIM